MKQTSICCAGEVMIEMAATGSPGQFQQGMAGDTYNTAVYLARGGIQVDYLTRLGDDTFSNAILNKLETEGIGTSFIVKEKNQQPGLYIIQNDSTGERYFSYWRSASPARRSFDKPITLKAFDAFYFSGITLAVTRSGHLNLVNLLKSLSAAGTQIIFDPNYRPGLWDSVDQAREFYDKVLGLCDTVLPTLDDEEALWGTTAVDQCEQFYRQYSVKELVIKAPKLIAHVFTYGNNSEHIVKQAQALDAIDTTGAGDSFSAGYLVERLQGKPIDKALDNAQALAAKVVSHRGAIIN